MIELRTVLQDFLKTLHPDVVVGAKTLSRVKYQEATKETPFPYIIFDFPNTLPDGEGFQNVSVDIDGWDNPSDGSTAALEALMSTINGDGETGLNKKTLATENLVVTFYLENKLSLQDDDKRIKRRKYVYQARLFERSGA